MIWTAYPGIDDRGHYFYDPTSGGFLVVRMDDRVNGAVVTYLPPPPAAPVFDVRKPVGKKPKGGWPKPGKPEPAVVIFEAMPEELNGRVEEAAWLHTQQRLVNLALNTAKDDQRQRLIDYLNRLFKWAMLSKLRYKELAA